MDCRNGFCTAEAGRCLLRPLPRKPKVPYAAGPWAGKTAFEIPILRRRNRPQQWPQQLPQQLPHLWPQPWPRRHCHKPVGTTFFVLLVAGAWLYSAWRISGPRQATLGLRWLGLKVTREDGQRLSFAHASARHWAKALSYMLCFLGCLMVLFTKRRQALHDKVCKTLVLRHQDR